MTRAGLLLEARGTSEYIPVRASTEIGAVGGAQVVFFCVKSGDTEKTAREMLPHLASGAEVVSLQNGVDNARRIQASTGIDAIPAVVYVACSMAGPGHVRHNGFGNLVIGRSAEIAALFERAEVGCRVSENIDAELWRKLIVNCAFNAISALTHAQYGRMVRTEGIRQTMLALIGECVEVARAEGIILSAAELADYSFQAGEGMETATSSTAQDIARGKPTEIDSLNGYVVRRGAELGVSTPVNQAMWALVTNYDSAACSMARAKPTL
jgi:2-dehydropantoate 2-reductase